MTQRAAPTKELPFLSTKGINKKLNDKLIGPNSTILPFFGINEFIFSGAPLPTTQPYNVSDTI